MPEEEEGLTLAVKFVAPHPAGCPEGTLPSEVRADALTTAAGTAALLCCDLPGLKFDVGLLFFLFSEKPAQRVHGRVSGRVLPPVAPPRGRPSRPSTGYPPCLLHQA